LFLICFSTKEKYMKIEAQVTTHDGWFVRGKKTSHELGSVPSGSRFVHLSLFMGEETIRLILRMKTEDGEFVNVEGRIEIPPGDVKSIGIYCNGSKNGGGDS
jgi:hypothetical protein